jgi:hypothetical protein
MFHKFDTVALKKPLPGIDVPVGATGTVLRVFHWTNPPAYHVCFHDWSHEEAFLVRGDDALELKDSIWERVWERAKGRK